MNFLQSANFKVVLQRAPNLVLAAKTVSIPSLSISPIEQRTPFSTINQQGETMTFGPLEITFRIDENLNNWSEIFNWMVSISFPEDYNQYANPKGVDTTLSQDPLRSDIEIVLFSSKGNAIKSFTFKDAWPGDLSSITFDIDSEGVEYQEATVSFYYTTYVMNEV